MTDHDERIRQRALEIWEEEGRPEGREYSHWLRARADVRAEEDERPAHARSGLILQPDWHPADETERASKEDIARNALPAGTVPENPTAENPDRITRLRPARARKPLDAREIDTQLDQPF